MKLTLILICIITFASSKLSDVCQKGLENAFNVTLKIAEEIKDG